jgi:hypothetical protein
MLESIRKILKICQMLISKGSCITVVSKVTVLSIKAMVFMEWAVGVWILCTYCVKGVELGCMLHSLCVVDKCITLQKIN